jgi:hypothetical protein
MFDHWEMSALIEDDELGVRHSAVAIHRVLQMGANIVPPCNDQSWQPDLIQALYNPIWPDQLDVHQSPGGPLVRL